MRREATILFAIAASCVMSAVAGNAGGGIEVEGFRAERNGGYMSLEFSIGLDDVKVRNNRAVVFTPSFVNGEDSIIMPSVAVYGRRRYYYYKRNWPATMITGKGERSFRRGKKPSEASYHELLPYYEWMNGAVLRVERSDYGCCRHLLSNISVENGGYSEPDSRFFPRLVYVQPEAEVEKRRSLEGRAYIEFPVDQTNIYPDYRRNTAELEAIRATIDAVRSDRDATIDTVWLKGYASPESPYSHNEELAVGRTEAVKRYIQRIYDFEGVSLIAEHEAEDWVGLRAAVAGSSLEHRDEILEIIDGDRDPDTKEWMIKSRYAGDYRYMLDHFYPSLRHTDYRVSYVVRTYSDADEILRIMATSPQKLSQDEFYVGASVLEAGSDEFTEVFETAVRMFPDDAVANLNAGNASLRRGDLVRAERYASKAGDSAEAAYLRGAIAIHRGDYDMARSYLYEASAKGLEQARITLDELNKRLEKQTKQ